MTALLLLAAVPARAHDVVAHGGSGWNVDPLIALLMLVSLSMQCIGLSRMGPARTAVAPGWRNLAYGAAMATLVLALFSPIDARADGQFSWHMLQHLLLILVAAPLFAVSNMHFVALYALPMRARRVVGRGMAWVPGAGAGASHAGGPWLAAAAFVAGLWLWHAPVMYEAALGDRAVHTFEHLVFLFTAAVFWRMVMTAGNRRLSLASAVLLVTLVGLQGNLMAALITLAPAPLYASYAVPGALLDQQVAGLIMWVPAGVIYLASTLWTLRRLMQ